MSSAQPADFPLNGNQQPPVVSVIVVNYRTYDELVVCLDSIAKQTLSALEVIVIDHDSRHQECELLRDRFQSARIISCAENPGFAGGVNRGARLARGRYLYLLNPDSVADPGVCATLAQWLDAHKTIGAVGSLVKDADGSIQASARRFPDFTTAFGGRTAWLTKFLPRNPLTRRNLLTGPEIREPFQVDWVSGASMMIRREAFEAVKGMDTGFFLYWEDADLCKRLRAAGWLTAYHPGPAITHLCGRSSQASTASIVAFHRSAYRYFWKHGGKLAILAAPLVYLGLTIRMLFRLWLRDSPAAARSTPQN